MVRGASQVAQCGKVSACQSWRHRRYSFDPWIGKILWSRKWQPTPVVLPEDSHGRGAWRATSPWGYKGVRHDWSTEHAQWLGLSAFITTGPGWIPGWGTNVNRKQKQKKNLSLNFGICLFMPLSVPNIVGWFPVSSPRSGALLKLIVFIFLCPEPSTGINKLNKYSFFSSVQFSCSVVSDSLWPHESNDARPPCASPTPGVYPNSCPLSRWCHPAISSSVVPFSPCPQSLPASGSSPINQSTLCIRWPKYWSFSFNISPSNEHPGLISFRMDWLDLLAVQGTFKSLL